MTRRDRIDELTETFYRWMKEADCVLVHSADKGYPSMQYSVQGSGGLRVNERRVDLAEAKTNYNARQELWSWACDGD